MKQIRVLLFSVLMGIAVAAQAVNQDVQVDLLMAKITPLLNAGKAAEALPYMDELESIGPSLSTPLPEIFYFYYIDTLDKTGDKDKALSRANAYLEKYGKNGKHYGQVIEIASRLQMQVDILERQALAREKEEKAIRMQQEAERSRLKAQNAPPVDNGDGTITDLATGLIGLKNANCFGPISFNSALSAARGLSSGSCGLSDGSLPGTWRMPTIAEKAILAKWQKSGALTGIPPPFQSRDLFYWVNSSDKGLALNVSTNEVHSLSVAEWSKQYLLPVRDAQ